MDDDLSARIERLEVELAQEKERSSQLQLENERATDELRQANERYDYIFRKAPAGIYRIDMTTGKLIDFNEKVIEYTGYSPSELSGIDAFKLLTPKSQEHFLGRITDILNGRDIKDSAEFEIVTKDGQVKHFVTTVNHIYTDGNISEALVVANDVSELKDAEQKFMKNMIDSRMFDSISTLAGGVAHEFNNALMGLGGYLELIEMSGSIRDSEMLYTGRMKESISRMAGLTSKLLAYGRGGKYQKSNIDANYLVKSSAGLISNSNYSSIPIEFELSESSLHFEGDPAQIETVLNSIISNGQEAISAKENSDGKIIIKTRIADSIDDYLVNPDIKYACIEISDDGVGMDKSVLERVFEPFYTTKQQGRGLGLAAVYGIVKHHDGELTFESEPGEGTSVKIYLPLKEDKQMSDQRQKIDSGNMRTILVVDDEKPVLEVCSKMLEFQGYNVIKAGGGIEACDIYSARKDEIDLVILDMMMPDRSGSETFDMMKTINPEVNVILSSGYALSGHAASIMTKGCRDFLQKPYDRNRLQQSIESVLSGE